MRNSGKGPRKSCASSLTSIRLKLYLAACLPLVIAFGWGVTRLASTGKASTVPRARLSESISVHASGRGNPWINLADGREMLTSYSGPAALTLALQQNLARPLAMTSADFDEDGVPDLICGYDHSGSGIISWLRGNVDSIHENSPEAKLRKAAGEFTDAPFLSPARLFGLPIKPEFLGSGDFDADGHRDVLAASRTSDALYFLPGDGRAGLGEARRVALPGTVTAFLTGEINRRDGLDDIAVAIASSAGPKVMVFEGPNGSLNTKPEVFDLTAEAASLALGQTDDDYPMDLIVAAGGELIIIHGRDRELSLDKKTRAEVPRARISRRLLPFTISSMALGDFSGDHRTGAALLSNDGTIHFLSQVNNEKESFTLTGGLPGRISNTGALSESQQAHQLISARLSSSAGDDLLVVDSTSRRLRIVMGSRLKGEAISQRQTVSLDVEGEPAAVLPMRLNADARRSLVVLNSGHVSPSVLVPRTTLTFAVKNTADGGTDSLRQAIIEANGNPGTDTIQFDIPGVGTQTIVAFSPLPPISESIIIDGTTQPGFTGTPGIEIAGTNASPDCPGLQINAGSTTVRGLVINGFKQDGIVVATQGNNIIEGNLIGTDVTGAIASANSFTGVAIFGPASNNVVGGTTASARNTISANRFNGVLISGGNATGNNVQGNFIGTDLNGSVGIGNELSGVACSDEASNNIIGGTTPGARNIISGAGTTAGVFMDGPNIRGNLVQGNFIGTNVSGTSRIPNPYGVLLTGGAGSNTIGGTVIEARNVISGNAQIGVALYPGGTSNLVQGNFIGTDASGASALGNEHEGYVSTSSNNTLGGSGPSARNVISGNLLAGASIISAGTTGNQVEGNYIGTDVSGAFPIANHSAGVIVSGGSSILIKDNLISSNTTHGISLGEFYIDQNTGQTGFGGTGVTITGNFIGTDKDGRNPLSNQKDGIFVENQSLVHRIENNIIAFNNRNGVCLPNAPSNLAIPASPAFRILISQNSIFSNATLGIDLGNNGVTPNHFEDPGQPEANRAQNFPVLTTAATDGADTTIEGTLNAVPNDTVTIEFFSNPSGAVGSLQAAAAGSCIIQGQTFLGSVTVKTNRAGSATISVTLPVSSPGGFISSTATSLSGNTSEFSACVQPKFVSADLSIEESAVASVVAGDSLSYRMTVRNNGPEQATNVVLVSSAPENTTFESLKVPDGWISTAPAAGSTGVIVSSNAGIVNGAEAAFTLAVKVNPGAADGARIVHSASVSSGTPDLKPGNNVVSLIAIVGRPAQPMPAADLSLDLRASPDSVLAGGVITYTLTVKNSGPDSAQAAVLKLATPANTTLQSIGDSDWTREAPAIGKSGDITYKKESFLTGQPAVFELAVKVNSNTKAGTDIVAAASISSATADPTAKNNSTSVTTRVRPPGPGITSIEVGSIITVVGSGFVKPVAVFIDDVGFADPSKVKGGTRVTQKGKLTDGRSITAAVPPGKVVKIKIRNSDGGEIEVSFRN